MAVICFGSLKGGVGKTSMSVNVAHAFAERGCETLLIDLDPMAHASRFFRLGATVGMAAGKASGGKSAVPRATGSSGLDGLQAESPLARLFLTSEFAETQNEPESVVECAVRSQISLIRPVRDQLALLPSGPELRHFLWGRGARVFRSLFPRLIEALECSYDYIIIDTPPDFNVLTRNAIASAHLAVVPVDSSAMSIHCLEEIVESAAHIKGPTWVIARTLVSKQASRIRRLSAERLQERLDLRQVEDGEDDELSYERSLTDPSSFISLVEEVGSQGHVNGSADVATTNEQSERPIYLLNSVVYRREQQNRLTFEGRTAFDASGDQVLRESYSTLARELEEMLAFCTRGTEPEVSEDQFQALSGIGLQ